MPFISLPALVQKVLIDTKSVREARAEATAFATRFLADMKRVDKATADHDAAQQKSQANLTSLIKANDNYRKSLLTTRKAQTDLDRATATATRNAKSQIDVEARRVRALRQTSKEYDAARVSSARYVAQLKEMNRALSGARGNSTTTVSASGIAKTKAQIDSLAKFIKSRSPQRIVVLVDTKDLTLARAKVAAFTKSNRDSIRQASMTEREYGKVVRETERAQRDLNAAEQTAEGRRVRYVRQMQSITSVLRSNDTQNNLVARGLMKVGAGFRKSGNDAGYFRRIISVLKIPALVAVLETLSSVASAGLGGVLGILGQYGPLLTGLTGGAINLVRSLTPLSGVFAALPIGLLALKSTLGVFKSLTGQTSKAAEAVAKYGANSAEAKRAMQGLSPTARGFVKELGVLRHEYDLMQKDGQKIALPKFQEALKIIRPLLKPVRTEFLNISNLLGTFSTVLARSLTMRESRNDVGKILKTNTTLIGLMMDAATPLVSTLRNVTAAAGPMAVTFAKAGVGVARTLSAMTSGASGERRLSNFFARTTSAAFSVVKIGKNVVSVFRSIGKATETAFGTNMLKTLGTVTGKLSAFLQKSSVQEAMERGFNKGSLVLKQFTHTVVDLSVTMRNLFSAAGRSIGIDFVGGLEKAASRWRAFTGSVRGQATISTYFKGTGPVLREIGLLLRDILKDFMSLGNNADVAAFIKSLRTDALPAIFQLTDGIAGRLGPAITSVISTFSKFVKLLSFSPIVELVKQISSLASRVLDFINLMPGVGPAVAMFIALGAAGKGLQVAFAASGIKTFVGLLSQIGPKGASGAAGMVGLAQGIRAVNAASAASMAPVVAANARGATVASTVTRGMRRTVAPGAVAPPVVIPPATVTGANRLGSALASGATRSAALRNGLGAVAGFLGGPFGIALAAGVVGLTLFAKHQAKAKQEAADLKAAIEADTGAIGEHTKAVTIDTLRQEGAFRRGKEFGINEKTITDATLGNADAQSFMASKLQELEGAYKASLISGSRNSAGIYTQIQRMKSLIDITGGQNDAIHDTVTAYNEVERASTGMTNEQIRQQQVIADTAKKYQDAKDKVDGLKTAVDNLVNSFTILRQGALDSTTANIARFAAQRTLVEGAKGNKSTNIKTAGGAQNVTNILDLAKTGQDQIKANQVENAKKLGATAATKLAATQATALRKSIFDTAVKDAGLNAKSVNAILDKIFKPKKDVTAQVKVIGAKDAELQIAKVEESAAALDAQRANPKIFVEGTTANRQLNGIITKLNAIDGFHAVATVDVAVHQGVLNKIRSQLSKLDRMDHAAADGGYFRKTGYIRGVGGPRDDKIKALVSDREFVMKAAAVQKYGVNFMQSLNEMQFADGGIVRKPTGAFGTTNLAPAARQAREGFSGPRTNAGGGVPVQTSHTEYKFYGDIQVADMDSVLRKAEREANLAALATGGNGTEGGGW